VSAAPQSSHPDDLIRSYQIISRFPCFIDGFDWSVRNQERGEAKRRKEVREAMRTTLVAYGRQSSTSVSGSWHSIDKENGIAPWLRRLFM
jgi:hypothetical protein